MARKQSTPTPLTPKQQALRDLDEARVLIGAHVQLASEAWNPRTLLRHSVQKHVWAWTAAAGVGGLLLLKLLLPSRPGKFDRDIASASDRKNGFIALLFAPMAGFARQAALKYGSQFLKTYLTQQFSKHVAPVPPTSEDPPAHV
jgi:hypothetical protein